MIVDRIDNSGAANVDEAQDRLFSEKDRYDAEMLELEKATPGSYGMAAQECVQCKKCARLSGHPCVHPDKMRYSLESIGAFPVKLVHDKFGFDILWSDGESIPEYYLLVAGLLKK
jgi:predicted metal-binding protein